MAFGWLQLTSNIGSIIGGLFSLLIAPITFMDIPGWRISFHLVGLISVGVGISVYLFANDPYFSDNGTNARRQVSSKTFWSEVKNLVEEAKSVSKILSFQIIVAQGITGSFPWPALSFAPLWLELTGFSHEETKIVPERARTSIYALDRCFESTLSSFAPPAVGILAQHVYGYKPIPEGSTKSQEILTDRENAASLGKALYTAIGIPMVICCFIYTFLYHAYPRDRERARMEALVESEMQHMESDSLPMHMHREFESEELYVRDYEW
ncbi:MFS transporter superfamily [Sesbania bispinosa]|nr:MFS transporter superfamily [Sesbania bispinosa]